MRRDDEPSKAIIVVPVPSDPHIRLIASTPFSESRYQDREKALQLLQQLVVHVDRQAALRDALQGCAGQAHFLVVG
jgi:hypothetical protein